ncbi:MAG: protein phosphatase 2C domain-containing protein [Oscillospiraceae bacterium]|nr:protein phosphatase 2C domain-containing protein [Oscillospiraceae bacterium]
MLNGFSHSVRGASHERTGLVCQDSSAYKVGERYAAAVVADGHGSKKHFRSNIGSKAATEAVLEAIERFYENADEFEKNFPSNHKSIIKNIEKQVISIWNAKVLKHLEENPVTDEEKKPFEPGEFEEIQPESYYGTTLIAAVAGRGFTFGFQIGDGTLVAVFDDGKASVMMDYEESNPANITASMCNANAASWFDEFYAENKTVLALFVSTDGLYTSFGNEHDFLAYHTIITSQLSDSKDFEEAVIKNMEKRSHYGTEDDVSLSCVFDAALINEKMDALKARIQENKQKK